MNLQQLNDFKKQINISADQILREEAEMIFLDELAKNKLSAKIVFYGGTALRLVYNSPRFSEDIDLIYIKPINFLEFKEFIQKIIKQNSHWQLKDLKNKRRTMFALILIKDEKLKHNFSLKIEIHKPVKKIKLKTELSLIKSPLSIAEPLLLTPTLNELKKLKENALVSRKKARDIFDLWYISKTLRENFILPIKMPKYSEREFKNELQVFLPKKYYPIIKQLYDKINSKN
ncbi:MAG: nucleotidyl transferase AbiEii/AbiGii toxin family protein [Candidatus Pacebacteria bacterium]|nr:nucleotidyl transferase AbiEii/AbiGii toxin family protein [Candidatus Paceibacterota bacterium]